MPLSPGTRLGQYEIVNALGTGGMGEVYRARDSRLDRDVALKVLPAGLASDEDRRARFEREAKAIAALKHPNIVTIHSIEDNEATQFLTMELVEGRTLADLQGSQGLPLDRVLKIAIPLADAVSAAHQRGITHRDLKPSNIMVTPDGQVKVLDFGLAKLREPDDAARAGETRMAELTGQNTIVGTAAYMSPEQAEGQNVDARSDIFSLGIVLYEMATGERPFKGDTSVSIISSIIKETPRLVSEVNPALPRDFARIVRRCLVKDPEHRYQSAKDVRNELEELKQAADSGELVAPRPAVPVRRGGGMIWIAGAVVVAAALLAFAVPWSRFASTPASALTATFKQLTTQAGVEHHPSLSPDGKWIVYEGRGQDDLPHIFLQSVGGLTAIDLTKDSSDRDRQPAFSPDGDQIAFRSERQGGGIFVMGRTGELPRRVSDAGYRPAWSPDGKQLVYASEPVPDAYNKPGVSELWIVDVSTGARKQLSKGDASYPSWSPNGKRIAYYGAQTGQRDIWTIAVEGGAPVAVTNDIDVDVDPLWSADGKYLYFSSDRGGSLNLWRIAIDQTTGQPQGAPEPLTTPSMWVVAASRSADGHLIAYTSMMNTSNLQRFAFDPQTATVKDAGTWITTGSTMRAQPEISPDGNRLVYHTVPAREDVFVSAMDGSGVQQYTNDRARNRVTRWSPDGKEIAFYSNRSGVYEIWAMNADGTNHRQLTGLGGSLAHPAWSPNGQQMAASNLDKAGVMIFDPHKKWSEQTPVTLPEHSGRLANLDWSPNGRKLLARTTAGVPSLVIYDFDSRTYTTLVRGVANNRWLDDGRILYSAAGRLMLLTLASNETRQVLPGNDVGAFSISRDGRQLVVARGTSEADIWMATIK